MIYSRIILPFFSQLMFAHVIQFCFRFRLVDILASTKSKGTSAAVWLRLQVRYDLEIAEQELSKRINREVKVRSQPSTRS
jgi:hypothetical protein